MKVVILAGGYGTRISEETLLKPKPMVEIDDMPLLLHLMKYYSSFGLNEFIICCGYKGYFIKEYFNNYFTYNADITVDLSKNQLEIHKKNTEEWKITLVDTGKDSMTGGRLKRVKNYLKNDDDFCFTYGDGLSDVDINDLISFHKKHKKKATVTAVTPPGRFGALEINDCNNLVNKFVEKPAGDGTRINGGFFVLSPKVIDYIKNDQTIWEQEPLKNLAKDSELVAYNHDGFWQPMDTLRDKIYLENLYKSNNAPWKVW